MPHQLVFRATSRKFWQARVKGSTLIVRFGKVGTEGQEVAKEFASAVTSTAQGDARPRPC
jgi:predicted DNA-binding WGR domain protein